jgi:hypothetical protein
VENRRSTDRPRERLEVRSEVTGLVFELIAHTEGDYCLLRVVDSAKIVLNVPLHKSEYDRLKVLFQKKNEPGCNFFDHVMATLDQATLNKPVRHT